MSRDRLDSDATSNGDLEAPDKPEGPIVAAVLAAGVGCFAMGVFTTLGEASTSFADRLTWNEDVGPLSGKTGMTIIVWLVSWAVLYVIFRNRQTETRQALTISLVLMGLGVLLTFPTFFQLFAPSE
jgi:lysylphosphatidylglycerol synthetase-like protein (DUF2156 family)